MSTSRARSVFEFLFAAVVVLFAQFALPVILLVIAWTAKDRYTTVLAATVGGIVLSQSYRELCDLLSRKTV